MEDFEIVYNEKTGEWEKKKEPFAVIEVETEEDFEFIKAATKEKVERDKGCKYCDFSNGDVGATINTSGDNFEIIKNEDGIDLVTDEMELLKINYCPMCGRKLEVTRRTDNGNNDCLL